MASESFLWW